MKILYLLSHLTRNYSIAMAFLKVNATLPAFLEGCQEHSQARRSSLEMLVMLLGHRFIYKDPQLMECLVAVIENITVHHFYKSINALVCNHAATPALNDPILISQDACQLLADLLKSDHANTHLHHLSRIIMRLSINDQNLACFIRFMNAIV
jgi:hypothetical protein